ncbi:sortase A [Microbacteriaceae bacterium MWH-Ta3]|nr:sortase A [Microbacteriaceae bacterium MWH-Ta3]
MRIDDELGQRSYDAADLEDLNRRASRRRINRILDVVQDTGITVGLLILLFLGWHVWLNDIVAGAQQNQSSEELSEQWAAAGIIVPEFDRATGNSDGAIEKVTIPVEPRVEEKQGFATMIVPRFGVDFDRVIAEGIDPKTVLNSASTGIGHYEQSNLLGEVGNFAVAAHRTTYGAPFAEIEKLRVGDRIYIETEAGWYIYRYRNTEYVWPKDVNVLRPVPRETIEARDRLLTMTSCHPEFSAAERIIAYSVFESFFPRALGVPTEIQTLRAEK